MAEVANCRMFRLWHTLDELEEDVRGAIETYIDAQRKLGKPVPEGPGLEGPLLRRWELAVS